MPERPHDLGTFTPDDFLRIRQIFEGALERAPDERLAFVERACDGDTALIAEVEGMLAAEGEPHELLDRARFRAGALFAERFRIVAALGRGGMGEVYRADDLELGQPVALKFLTALRSNDRARSRLRTEVRLARQISHPNVCRVYDIGEAQGDLYLSMEYVDGEDLAALLTRIGRLPVDKGIEIARKLCAGLAAAHAKGVVHRDFKPANIMIESAGGVRIMDFGLAAVDRLDAADVRSGTPAYMAPEQLAGREATARSDLYALGLVLYEMFTGESPFPGTTIDDLQQRRQSHPSTPPSTLIPEIGPRVERAILRCLEPDPKRRPASALDVAASLPGGDPVAEALAAGETPSPAMVADWGPISGLTLHAAASLLAGVGVGVVTALLLAPKSQIVGRAPFEYPPEVLTRKAQDIIRGVGFAERPGDFAAGFERDRGRARYLEAAVAAGKTTPNSPTDRLTGAPFLVVFSYRQDDQSLARPIRPEEIRGWVPLTYEAPASAGAVWVTLELDGRLRRLVADPLRIETSAESSLRTTDWSLLFAAAALDIGQFAPAQPRLTPLRVNDTAAAWTGTYPGDTDLPVRVEAAAYQGRATYFAVIFPWQTEESTSLDGPRRPPAAPSVETLLQVLGWTLTVTVGVVAYRNWKAGRADLRGASRIGIGMFSALLLVVILGAHDVKETVLHGPAVGWCLFNAAMCAMGYIAFEPWVRRQSPQEMITWSRVLAGRWHDPVVGRDILVGVLAAVAVDCLRHVTSIQLTAAGCTARRLRVCL